MNDKWLLKGINNIPNIKMFSQAYKKHLITTTP